MTLSGATRTFAVVGHPVAHSLSPALHNPELQAHGIDAVYVALEVDPALGPRLVDALRVLPLAGVNLTVPFKQAVVGELDAVEGFARTVGAVNTVVRDGDRLVGHNTDGEGFVGGLRHQHGDVVTGARCLVLGAGGAGLAVGAALAQSGATEVVWLNRTVGRAEAACERVAPHAPDAALRAGALDAATFAREAASATLVVQATSGPGAAVVAGFDAAALAPESVWCDLNYWMSEPPLMGELQRRGYRTQDGRPMLAWQAAGSFRLFTGISPDPTRMLQRIG